MELARSQRHLQECPDCAKRLEETHEFVWTLRIALVYRELRSIKTIHSPETDRAVPLWKRHPARCLGRLEVVTLKWTDTMGMGQRAVAVVEYASTHGLFLRLLRRISKDTALTILRPHVELHGTVRYWEYRGGRHYVGIRYSPSTEEEGGLTLEPVSGLRSTHS